MKFLHPHVDTRIIDNSQVSIVANGGGTALFAPIVSDLGEDNVIREMSDIGSIIKNYGTPDFARHGQEFYNLLEWVRSGGRAYVLRLLPNDATFANLLLSVKVTKADKSVIAKAESKKTNISSLGALQASFSTIFEDSGREEYPLAYFIPKGRGKAYNGIGVRIEVASTMDRTYNFRTYNVSITRRNDLGEDVAVEGPFLVSLYPGAKSLAQESLHLPVVLNRYSEIVTVVSPEFDNYEKICEALLAGKDIDPRLIDILGGTAPANEKAGDVAVLAQQWKSHQKDLPNPAYDAEKAREAKEKGTLYSEAETIPNPAYDASVTNLNRTQHLENGSDGTLDATAKTKLLAQAFDGVITPDVSDIDGVEIDMVLDANWDYGIKTKAAQFVRDVRGDAMFLADLRFQGNVAQTLNARKNDFTVGDFYTAIFAQHGEVFDSYTGSQIKVTTPYILASKIPGNDTRYGIHWPFVGPRRGIVEGFNNVNFYPNAQQKESLYLQKVNYIERDPRRTNFGSQLTSQPQNSSLSDISHVRTLLRIRRDVRKIAQDYRMEFNDEMTLAGLSYDINQYLSQYLSNRACEIANATVSASEYDKQQRIARVYVNLKFTGILERIQVDIVVGK